MSRSLFIVSFVFLNLSLGLSPGYALSPKSSLNQESPRIESFPISLQKALKDPEFKKIFRIHEDVVIEKVMDKGDIHAYFKIKDIKIGPDSASITASYLVQDEKDANYGVWKTKAFNFKGNFNGKTDQLLRKFDVEVVKSIYYEDEDYLLNSTKLVLLKGVSTGKQYAVYYKFGEMASLESLGFDILKSFQLKTPKMYAPKGKNYLWLEDLSYFSVKEAQRFIFPKPLQEHSHIEKAFYHLGIASALAFILGHDDVHAENLLLIENEEIGEITDGTLIDFETIGQLAVRSRFMGKIPDHAELNWELLRSELISRGLIGDAHLRLIEQTLKGWREIANTPQIMNLLHEKLQLTGTRNFNTRVLLFGTSEYNRRGYAKIPHYSMEVTQEELLTLFAKQLKMLKAFTSQFSSYQAYWQSLLDRIHQKQALLEIAI